MSADTVQKFGPKKGHQGKSIYKNNNYNAVSLDNDNVNENDEDDIHITNDMCHITNRKDSKAGATTWLFRHTCTYALAVCICICTFTKHCVRIHIHTHKQDA